MSVRHRIQHLLAELSEVATNSLAEQRGEGARPLASVTPMRYRRYATITREIDSNQGQIAKPRTDCIGLAISHAERPRFSVLINGGPRLPGLA